VQYERAWSWKALAFFYKDIDTGGSDERSIEVAVDLINQSRVE
jgi:hypothetical protein